MVLGNNGLDTAAQHTTEAASWTKQHCGCIGWICKNGEGSAGYIILNKTNDTRIESSLPVDGSPETMTSYRTELYGILVMSLSLKVLIATSPGAEVQGAFYCNNEQAVKMVEEIRKDQNYPRTIKRATEGKHKVLYEIKK